MIIEFETVYIFRGHTFTQYHKTGYSHSISCRGRHQSRISSSVSAWLPILKSTRWYCDNKSSTLERKRFWSHQISKHKCNEIELEFPSTPISWNGPHEFSLECWCRRHFASSSRLGSWGGWIGYPCSPFGAAFPSCVDRTLSSQDWVWTLEVWYCLLS